MAKYTDTNTERTDQHAAPAKVRPIMICTDHRCAFEMYPCTKCIDLPPSVVTRVLSEAGHEIH